MSNRMSMQIDKRQKQLIIQSKNCGSVLICNYTDLDYLLVSMLWCCNNNVKFKSCGSIYILTTDGNDVRIYSNLTDNCIETTYMELKTATETLFENMFKLYNKNLFLLNHT